MEALVVGCRSWVRVMTKWLLRILCSPLFLICYALGWRVAGAKPCLDKAVLIASRIT